MSRRSIWLRLLAALAAGTLAAAGVGVGAWWSISPRATLTFAASKDFYPEEFSKDGSRLLGRIYLGPSATDPVAVWDVATGGKGSHPRQERRSGFASQTSLHGLYHPGEHVPLLPPTRFHYRQ